MNKFDRRKFQAVYILTFFLILISIVAPIMEELQQNSGPYYEEGEAAVLPSYPGGGVVFLKTSPVYRGPYGKAQALRYGIFIALVFLFLFKVNKNKASVFSYSRLFLYLIKRYNTSVMAFSLGGRAPPRS
jgi:hypothetical protein